jgi:hypothetical protein
VTRALVLGTGALLAACSPAADPPGTMTADDRHQLNEAAAMLDADSISLNAVSNQPEPAR